MTTAATLVDLVRARAERSGPIGYGFLTDGAPEARLSHADLDQRSRAVALLLTERGAAGEPVLLPYPAGLDFLAGFFGCLYAGAIAVPAPVPVSPRAMQRLAAVAHDAQARYALTTPEVAAELSGRPETARMDWLSPGHQELEGIDTTGWRAPGGGPTDTAFVQYSSGSTGSPKGVALTHAQTLANLRAIQRSIGTTADSRGLLWLPMFHDMGLVAGMLHSLWAGFDLTLMSPQSFVRDPYRWLREMSERRATFSALPNFGFDMCVRKVSEEQRATLDLSAWEQAVCGSEPIRDGVLQRFGAAFAASGFSRNALMPAYGLAEATVLVTCAQRGGGAHTRPYRRDALEAGRALLAPRADASARVLVSSGVDGEGITSVIVDPRTSARCQDRVVGEVWVSSPALGRYWNRPVAENDETFAAYCADGSGPYLRTGDLAFKDEGELFVAGRSKDLVILRGRNFAPQDLEASAEDAHPLLRPGGTAAFSVEVADEERLVLVQEIRPTGPEQAAEATRAIRQRLAEEHGVRPHAVVLVRPGRVPKTSSGKIQRRGCRQAYLDGTLPTLWTWTDGAEEARAVREQPGQQSESTTSPVVAGLTSDMALMWLRMRVAGLTGTALPQVDAARPLLAQGLDSLQVMEVQQGLATELGVQLSPRALVTAASLTELAATAVATPAQAATGGYGVAGERPERVPLSVAQRGIWLAQQREPESTAFHVHLALRFTGALDVEVLTGTLRALAERHETLRTSFPLVAGEPTQLVHPAPAVRLPVEDLSGLGEREQLARVAEIDQDAAGRRFDLENGPPWRVRLLRLDSRHHLLLLTLHHLLADGAAVGVLLDELTEVYRTLANGRSLTLSPPAVQYADHTGWSLDGTTLAQHRAYWADHLRELPEPLELPGLRAGASGSGARSRGASEPVVIAPDTWAAVRGFAAEEGVTPFTVLVTALGVLLSRVGGRSDLVIGFPVANRPRAELAGTVGQFANTLPLRCDLSGAPSFRTALARTRDRVFQALSHQSTPLSTIVTEVTGSTPFRVAVTSTPLPWQRTELPGLRVGWERAAATAPEFDLLLSLVETPGGVDAAFVFDQARFEPWVIAELATALGVLLTAALARPGQAVCRLPLLSAAERQRLTVDWNRTSTAYPREETIHGLFAEQVALRPDALAVQAADQHLTYRELEQAATGFAHRLRAAGVRPGDVVPLYTERSAATVVALLGVVRAGASYLPLSPTDPPTRSVDLVTEAGAKIVVADRPLPPPLHGLVATVVTLESIEATSCQDGLPVVSATDPAYVLFTSGTSGRPKGVRVPHRAVVRLVRGTDYAVLDHRQRFLQLAPLSFDAATFELWGALLNGATLVVPAAQQPTVTELVELVRRERISTLWLTAGLFERFARQDLSALTELRQLLAGGDVLSPEAVRAALASLPDCAVVNGYGPTEATTFSTTHRIRPGDAVDSPVPIGRPIANSTGYVLDAGGEPVPVGVPGQLHVGGDGLALDYLDDAELTAERFGWLPATGERVYRTGDLVRHRPDGVLEFLGRIDQQVKIRGFRVEPGEVESALRAHPAVRAAVVTAREQRLVAHVERAGGAAVTEAELVELLAGQLPEHLVPTAVSVLDALPLTANGKVDRAALPAPHQQPRAEQRPPASAVEVELAGIWRELLGVEQVYRDDRFVALGGHSLLAMDLVHRIERRWGTRVSLRALFERPALAELAELVESGIAAGQAAPSVPAEPPRARPEPEQRYAPFPLTDIQQAYWVGRRPGLELGGIGCQCYLEIDTDGLDVPRLTRALRRLIDRHDMLRAVVLPSGEQQVLASVPDYEIDVLDLTDRSPAEAEQVAERLREQLSHGEHPTDVWPLFDFRVTRLPDGTQRLHLRFDALIFDAASGRILQRELTALYQNPAAELPALELTFRDYLTAEAEVRQGPEHAESLRYWTERIPSLPPAPELPLTAQPSTVLAPRFRRRTARLSAPAWAELKRRGAALGLTPTGVVLAAFNEVLAAWSQQPRFTLSLTLFQRLPLHQHVDRVLGDFTSLVLLAADRGGGDFTQRARALSGQLAEDLDHRTVSGVHVLRELARARGKAGAALMPVVVTSTLGGDADTAPDAMGLGRLRPGISQTPQVLLDHQVFEEHGELLWNWDCVEELFPAGLLDAMFEAYHRLLTLLAEEESAWRRDRFDLVPAAQLAVRAADNTREPVPAPQRLDQLVARTVQRDPSAPAVIAGQRVLSYGELWARAEALAARLRAHGVGRGDLVAVVMDKGWEQAVATLGVLRAGAAYVPIEPELPELRRHHLLDHTQVRVALTQDRLLERLSWPPQVTPLAVTAEPVEQRESLRPVEPPTATDDLAYVIYTSGSTGQPKGVMIEHGAAANTVVDVNRRFGIGPGDRVLGLSSLSFDLSVYDLFGIFAAGGTLVLPAAAESRSPAAWDRLVREHRVTVWNSVPALAQLLVDHVAEQPAAADSPLRQVLLSGDWIPVNLPARLAGVLGPTTVTSLGGATEASIWSITHPAEQVEPGRPSIPYGRPMTGQPWQVLDAAGQPRPDWVVGPLYIGGVGLARGYWRDAERTAAAFSQHPRTGQRLYRTGDLGRYWPDGTIELIGREDHQVKVQGYRIELGEIETVLETHPGISRAVATTGRVAGGQQLRCHLVTAGTAPADTELAAYLRERLPAYMVPAVFVTVDSLPLSANGKVDRAALPEPAARPQPGASAPDSALTAMVAAAWQEVLGLETVDTGLDFAGHGGTSMSFVRLHARLERVLGRSVPLADLLQRTTVGAQAQLLTGQEPTALVAGTAVGAGRRRLQEQRRRRAEGEGRA